MSIVKNLINTLYKQGLGELLTLHVHEERIFFGNMLFEKGRLVIKDSGLLSGVEPAQLMPCWENGGLGLLCAEAGFEWDSLTFYGLDRCNVPVDFSKTRHGALVAAENRYGDRLVDFVGSVYRAYQLMLENYFLPVVLLKDASTKNDRNGLIISDLSLVPMESSVMRAVYDATKKSVEKHLVLRVDDVQIDSEEFNNLFGNYLENPGR